MNYDKVRIEQSNSMAIRYKDGKIMVHIYIFMYISPAAEVNVSHHIFLKFSLKKLNVISRLTQLNSKTYKL